MAIYSTIAQKLSPPQVLNVPSSTEYVGPQSSYLHKNDALKSTHPGNLKSTIVNNIVPGTSYFLEVRAAAHKTLLSTLYQGQDKYILDVWTETNSNGDTLVKTLSNSNDVTHFVFVRSSDGVTYTNINKVTNSYSSEFVSPIQPEEIYAATTSRVMFITAAGNFQDKTVLNGLYEFGSICDTASLEDQLNTCLQEKATLQVQLTQAQNDLAACQASLSTCQSDLSNCQASQAQCSSDLANCTNNLTTCQGNLSTCQNDLTTCQAQNTQLQNDLTTCSNDLTNCQATVTQQQDTINTLNQQVTSLQNQVITLQDQISDLQGQIVTLQNALDDCIAQGNPYVDVVNYSITPKTNGILVQVETENASDLYLFVRDKSTNEIVKVVKSLVSTTNHTIYIPIVGGEYVIDYLSLKPINP